MLSHVIANRASLASAILHPANNQARISRKVVDFGQQCDPQAISSVLSGHAYGLDTSQSLNPDGLRNCHLCRYAGLDTLREPLSVLS